MTEPYSLMLTFQNLAQDHDHQRTQQMTFDNVEKWTLNNQKIDGYRIIEVTQVDGTVHTFFETDQYEMIRSLVVRKRKPLGEVYAEMERQVAKWGQQNHASFTPQGVLESTDPLSSELAKLICDLKAQNGAVSWTDIFLEEVFEAIDEAKVGDLVKLRTELVQVAAVAVSWIESIDRNQK